MSSVPDAPAHASRMIPPRAPGTSAATPETPAARRWAKLNDAVFRPVPAGDRAGFARSVAYTNWLHAAWIAGVAAAVNALFGLLPELQYYRSGLWAADRGHLAITGLHGFMVTFSLAALLALRRTPPATKGLGEPLHQWLAVGYASVMLAAVTAFSVFEQRLTGSISAYLLGLAAFTTLFYFPARLSLGICSASLAALVGGSVWLYPGTRIVWHHAFVGLDAMVLFWIGSRITYYLKATNYRQLVTIERQARVLAASNTELARASQFKSDLLSAVAHDLRDPLGTISLQAQTLRDELPPDSPPRVLVDGIDESSRHLAEFVGNLLGELSTENDAVFLERGPITVADVMPEIIAALRPVAAVKSIKLCLTLLPPALLAPPAAIGRACLRQIIENLVRNAVKFSPAHRRVWVELTHAPERGHRISVRDEGPGFTAEEKARLFGKYQRLSATPTNGEASTGLGLFIVKSLVTLHHGHVQAESDGPGRGATFVVVLP